MPTTQLRDVLLATLVSAPLPLLTARFGDPLYVSIWYYLGVPAAFIAIAWLMRTPAFFIFGAGVAVAVSLCVYLFVAGRQGNREGLLAAGHLFSLPGAALGVVLAGVTARRSPPYPPFAAFAAAFAGFGVGFTVNQVLLCNSVMMCGPVSFVLR